MSGLIEAMAGPFDYDATSEENARAAALAMADWLDKMASYQCREVARLIREEMVPPPPLPSTAEDAIRKALAKARAYRPSFGRSEDLPQKPDDVFAAFIVAELRDARLLKEDAS